MHVRIVIFCLLMFLFFIETYIVFRVGVPPKPLEIPTFALLAKRSIVTGSLTGGMKETQEMLNFCGEHGITCDIEKIKATPETISAAYDRAIKGNIKYRFVLDILNSFK